MNSKGGNPVAFLQVDLDGLWAVRRCYGGRGAPEEDDPVYSRALPGMLELLDRLEVKATFFVVGADAQVAWKCRHLEAVVNRGHELANHSMTHDLGLGGADRSSIEKEVLGCQEVLKTALGVEARGFRAPGYGISPAVIETLARLDFWYDGSLFPSPWGWIMRWLSRRISASVRRDKVQFGSVRGGRAPLRPYHPDPLRPEKPASQGQTLWEIPVSVTPRLRLPFHGGIGFLLGTRWVGAAIRSLARGPGFLNYLIHGMDLVDGREWRVTPGKSGSRWFAGSARERLDFFAGVCERIRQVYEIQRTDSWAEQARKRVEND